MSRDGWCLPRMVWSSSISIRDCLTLRLTVGAWCTCELSARRSFASTEYIDNGQPVPLNLANSLSSPALYVFDVVAGFRSNLCFLLRAILYGLFCMAY